MKCPKCVGKLQEKSVESVKIDACYVCEGIWFDKGEIEEIIKKDSANFKYINIDRDELDGKEVEDLKKELDEKKGECPKCADGTLLIQEKNEENANVNVDVCPKGHGIWLDGGEIQNLRKGGLTQLMKQFKFFLYCIKVNMGKS